MTGNRAVVYSGPCAVKVEKLDYPKLVDPRGKKCEHGVIIKLVTTNICGSDLHIYRGRFDAPEGMVLGHENTGEVVETGRDVEFIKTGDLVSVPFNVACGRCRNCRERHTDICLNVNPETPCGAYGFNLGGWQGGQAEYMMVPYADFQLLKFPDRDQAMEHILDLTLLSDILPTGFHGGPEGGVGPGSTVYIAGAGPVGRCAAARARLVGALHHRRGPEPATTRAGQRAGFEVVDLSKDVPLADQIEAILGVREVDCGVDCVGFEAHGYGPDAANDKPVSRAQRPDLGRPLGRWDRNPRRLYRQRPRRLDARDEEGAAGHRLREGMDQVATRDVGSVPGDEVQPGADAGDPLGPDGLPRQGHERRIDSPRSGPLKEAYRIFDDGAPKKFVIDPHGSVAKKKGR